MSHYSPDQQKSRFERSLSIEDADGEELLDPEDDDQIVVASDGHGNSLTLLEEYSRRKSARVSSKQVAFSFACAAASLAFAALLYLNTH